MTKREQILERLLEVLQSTPGVASVGRNRGLFKNEQRPTLILLDGSERAQTNSAGRGHRTMLPNIMVMSPQVVVVLRSKLPTNEGIGEELNEFCDTVTKAIGADSQLIALITTNGSVAYNGLSTDLQLNAPMEGRALIELEIRYPYDPRQ